MSHCDRENRPQCRTSVAHVWEILGKLMIIKIKEMIGISRINNEHNNKNNWEINAMALFAISDLHLSLGGEKPMDIFGSEWADHHLKIKENWGKIVSDDDVVILGGDLCWAMKLEDAQQDFAFVHQLPGKKVLFKGNHDYWWQSYSKVVRALPEGIYAVQNNYFAFENGIAICGTRGWTIPGEHYTEQDVKIFKGKDAPELSWSSAK